MLVGVLLSAAALAMPVPKKSKKTITAMTLVMVYLILLPPFCRLQRLSGFLIWWWPFIYQTRLFTPVLSNLSESGENPASRAGFIEILE
jgi:hypothetical protein